MRLLALASLCSYASYVARLVERPAALGLHARLLGVALFIAATGLFWWAILASRRVRLNIAYGPPTFGKILDAGPFAWVRHPFYLSYILFWIGTALTTGGWQWIPALILVGWYVSIAVREERVLSRGRMAAEYIEYQRKTGMFTPAVRRLPQ